MRGSRELCVTAAACPGIIPAHAGLTRIAARGVLYARDHPRACGAHPARCSRVRRREGSSPRMRGSHLLRVDGRALAGIIPAHAGLTSGGCPGRERAEDHPRACGAHTFQRGWAAITEGSSPRMRGSLAYSISFAHGARDHPRACGAHVKHQCAAMRGAGSSPRMRGSRRTISFSQKLQGIIPAHAGLTYFLGLDYAFSRDHPRACGAHLEAPVPGCVILGSSPRMRGSQSLLHDCNGHAGIIPAHAGLTIPAP